ncbi:MAG: helix-turn-helix domain-containing protein [Wenzhouxiangella sp.]|jgi:cytoskeleton protein RodZ|nr:helix-turn-helix domain-containing protein [Wenzhouxiangella sp.]
MTENVTPSSAEPAEPNQLRLPVGGAEEEIGVLVKQQRVKRKIKLENAARDLKLSPATLERIERGDLEHLAPIYRRGYVRNYALYLGLDPDPLLSLLEAAEPPALRSVMASRKRPPRFDKILKFSTYLIVTTVIVPPLVLIYIQGGSRFIERESVVSEPLSSVAVPSASDQRVADRVARALSLDDTAPAADSVASGDNAPVAASALPLSSIRPLRDPATAFTESTAQTVTAEMPPESTGSVLSIEVLEDSWLEVYSGDGERLEYDLLRGGDRRRFEAEPPFRLLLGRASAVALELDGKPVEFEGQDRADVASFDLLADGVIRR